MSMWRVLSCLFLLVLLVSAAARHRPQGDSSSCSWNKCNAWSTDKDVINVHIVPHTHDDLGWIKTVDQYFFGTQPNLVPVGVQYIYSTVIDELAKDPTKRFSFAETGFLERWMHTNGEDERKRLQQLVANGQVELIGGGWVQNDEAAAHYVDVIDQMELGHKYLDSFFGECGHPQTAWQIDPFGHSREVANLFAMMGFSSLFFARMHYLERAGRLANVSLEFDWNTSDDFKTKILTGGFYLGRYGPPTGFCFDRLCGDEPIVDNEDMEGYNLPERLLEFDLHVRSQAAVQKSRHVLLLMGDDFQYTNANMWYTSLDKIIRHVNANKDMKLRAFYSTPSCYARAIKEATPTFPTKDDDFFPYASSAHSFWTGYFTSRPAFKRMIREASGTLQLAKQLDAAAFLGAADGAAIELLKRASALAQHHDAVTGTAKEAVTHDYEKRLAVGMYQIEKIINDALAKLTAKKGSRDSAPAHFICPLINETVCAPLKGQTIFAVTLFNSQAATVSTTVRIPYYSKYGTLKDGAGNTVPSQIGKTFQSALSDTSRAPYELIFPVQLQPLGFATFFVDNSFLPTATRVSHPIQQQLLPSGSSFIENQFIKVLFDNGGYVQAVEDKEAGVSYPLRQEFFYYEGNDNTNDQTSGAYVFRPKTNQVKRFDDKLYVEFAKGHLSEEVRQTVSSWASQSVRVYNGSRDIEFAWTIGPIPKESGHKITKEVITRYTTNIQSGGVFFTDANGRQLMKRRRNYNPAFTYADTEPVAGNYYPVTSSVHIADASSQFTVLVDRSEGATSLSDGVVDVMLHRRCFYDDHWGVDEALDEPGTDGRGLVVTGIHLVQIGRVKDGAGRLRLGAQATFHRPTIAFAPLKRIADYTSTRLTAFDGLRRPLPSQVHLLTLSKWRDNQLLLRLEHIFQGNDNDARATSVTVDLTDLFTTFTVQSKREVLLSGVRDSSALPNEKNDLSITLKPMEIRTFILDVTQR